MITQTRSKLRTPMYTDQEILSVRNQMSRCWERPLFMIVPFGSFGTLFNNTCLFKDFKNISYYLMTPTITELCVIWKQTSLLGR